MPEYLRSRQTTGLHTLSTLEPLPPNRLPPELTRPAPGRFPLLEQGLKSQGCEIPADWTVANMLSAISVSASSTERLETEISLPALWEVRLILDPEAYRVSERTGFLSYRTVDYEVTFQDRKTSAGRLRMPGFYLQEDNLAGLPMTRRDGNDLDLPEEHREVFGEKNLVDEHLQQFTPKGMFFLKFLATNIGAYNDYSGYIVKE